MVPRAQDASATSTSPESFVEHYVELGMASDYEAIVDLIIDDRFTNDNRQTKVDTYKMLQEDLPALKNYEIKEVKDATNEEATVLTLLEYEDGSIEQTPMHLVKEKGDWKLQLGSEDANADKNYKQIKQPNSFDEM